MTPETASRVRGAMDNFVRQSADQAGFHYPMAAMIVAASGHVVTFRYEGDAQVIPVGGYDPPDGCEWRMPATMVLVDKAGKAGGPFIFYDDQSVEALKAKLFTEPPAELS